jgi:hypothetical protein
MLFRHNNKKLNIQTLSDIFEPYHSDILQNIKTLQEQQEELRLNRITIINK